MTRFLNPIAIVIITLLLLTTKFLNAQEISEKEYLRLKNRLKAEFMQKLKEEIKKELIEELKTESPSSQRKSKVEEIKSNYDIKQARINDPRKETEDIMEEETVKYAEYQKGAEEIELDKARYRLGEGLTFGEQLLTIRGFGNLNARYLDNNVSENFDMGNNFFSLGEFDLFMTSRLSNRISFLGEIVFEFESEETEIDPERLIIRYDVNNLLKINVGKFHLPIGYWLPTYHHGVWLQTTIDRPDIFNFEDKGGPLPSHAAGAMLSGSALLEGFDLNYACTISNGRGVNTTQLQVIDDRNDKKALSLQLEVQPHIVEGLKLGPSIYYDVIPEDKTNSSRESEIREIIYGGHIVYTIQNIELLTEAFEINHDELSGGVFNTFGGYAQFAYTIDKFKPYYRYDYIDYSNDDPFYRESEFDFLDTKKHTIGLRYELSHFNALKFEYSHGVFDDEDVNIVGLQTAFAF